MTPNSADPDEVDPHQTRQQFVTHSGDAPTSRRPASRTEEDTRRFSPDLPATTPQTTEGTRYQGGERTAVGPGSIEVGRTLYGKYRVIRRLGGGAMGDVWLVRHSSLNRDHALKMIVPHLASHQGALVRFQREFQVMASFHHEHAIEIYDARLDEEGGYIDMQYVEGQTITEILAAARNQEGRDPSAPLMPFSWILRVLGQLCEVLDVAHEAGIVHRDLKPSNLMLLGKRPPGREFLKVLDFGIAKIRNDPENNLNDPTLTGGFIGTPSYSSPEQVYSKPIDGRSDLYSVGVILYEMVCGRLPFVGQQVQVMMQHAQQPPPPLRAANPALRVAPEVEHAILRVLSKDPDHRPATGRLLYEEFAQAAAAQHPHSTAYVPLDEATSATPPTWDAVPCYSPPVEATEPDSAAPPGRGPIATASPTSVAAERPREGLDADPASEAEQHERRRHPLRIPAVLAFLVLASAGAFFLMNRGAGKKPIEATPIVLGGDRPGGGDGPAVPRRTSLPELPDGYRALKGAALVDGWPEQIVRDEDKNLYRFHAPGIYLPDGFAAEPSAGSPELVQGWPRVIVRTDDPTHARYVRIPGGIEFEMGSWDAPKDVNRKDYPPHPVIVSGFYLQEFEVSNGQIENYFTTAARPSPVRWQEIYDGLKQRNKAMAPNHPAVNISRRDATAYAESFGAKLPTEAQWEYAARSLGQRRRYVWGGEPPSDRMANIQSVRDDVTTTPSGEYPRDETEQHIFDMAGNVQEWCRDAWSPYQKPSNVLRDPFVAEGSPGKVERYAVRGGSWYSTVDEVYITEREKSFAETELLEYIGFRVVIECPEFPPTGDAGRP
ncbi:bifunctional serine/threonine-protein kinase/formylglycine-generating enzyme family protein [Tundrisphaera sp. TA3]|uniref:bifunctional serine/threonine-protein kinase/formylglycine-generating enzyme family protein n=1 Tax=Tundrisphaera sp. TA3 TaxID=3435775 RepID=UPI003EBB456A